MEEYLFRIVQRVTFTVKFFPFFYVLGLMLYWLIAPALSITAVTEIDGAIFLSFVMALFLIRLSYCLKLCKWHRFQCCLPLFPQIVDKVDVNVYEFGTYLAIINDIVFGVIAILSLINAYFVFMKPMLSQWKRKRGKLNRKPK